MRKAVPKRPCKCRFRLALSCSKCKWHKNYSQAEMLVATDPVRRPSRGQMRIAAIRNDLGPNGQRIDTTSNFQRTYRQRLARRDSSARGVTITGQTTCRQMPDCLTALRTAAASPLHVARAAVC